MKKILLFLVFVFLVSLIYSQVYDIKSIIFKNDSYNLVSIDLSNAETGPFPISLNNNYHFELLDKRGKIIFNQPFTLNFVVYPDPNENETATAQVISINQSYTFWRLPYSEDVKSIRLYHNDKLIWDYDVEYLSKQNTAAPQQNPQIQNNNLIYGLVAFGFCISIAIIIGLVYYISRTKKVS